MGRQRWQRFWRARRIGTQGRHRREALEKWVPGGASRDVPLGTGSDAGVRAASAPKGTTGWEALEKWVPGGAAAAPAAGPSGTTGWEALEKWVPGGAAARARRRGPLGQDRPGSA